VRIGQLTETVQATGRLVVALLALIALGVWIGVFVR
jgi:hypothetical protein